MAPKDHRPNILHFICHDLGQELHCYGNPTVESPRLDALAAEGVRFSRFFAASTPCSPSRGCIMTGRYAHSTGLIGLVNRGWDLPDREKTLVDHLNEAGYETWHFGLQHERKDPARNRYAHEIGAGRPVWIEAAGADVIRFLGSADARRGPWYLNIGTFEVHLKFNRPLYVAADPAKVHVPSYLPDDPDVRLELARFHGAIRFMDLWIGHLLDALDRTGLREDTAFLFTTDHGAAFPRAKSTLYDSGIGTALIGRFPERLGVRPGTCGALLSNIDLAPTLLEMVGAPVPPEVQGRSFWPLLAGRPCEPRAEVYSEKSFHDRYDPMRCIRTDRYKYIRSFENVPNLPLPKDILDSIASRPLRPDALQPRPPEELYHLEADPGEEHNRAADPALRAVRDRLASRLEAWMRDTGDFLPGPMPPPPPEQWL